MNKVRENKIIFESDFPFYQITKDIHHIVFIFLIIIWTESTKQSYVHGIGIQSQTVIKLSLLMMTSSNGNILRATGPLWGESTDDRWIPLTKASGVAVKYILSFKIRAMVLVGAIGHRIMAPCVYKGKQLSFNEWVGYSKGIYILFIHVLCKKYHSHLALFDVVTPLYLINSPPYI